MPARPLRVPLDPFPYAKDPESQPVDGMLADGLYAYVQDEKGIVHAIPDGPHVHPKVLGGARSALYAGDFTVANHTVIDLTNLSGTFQFDDSQGLLAVADEIRKHKDSQLRLGE
jgi:hypothetical protein